MAAHYETNEMKSRPGHPSSQPGQHFETAGSRNSSDSPIDLEKRGQTTNLETGDHALSHVVTQDGEPVVTLKTWAVVAVRYCRMLTLSSVSNRFSRCSQLRTAYHSGQSHTSAPFKPRCLRSLALLHIWALGTTVSQTLQGGGDMLTPVLLGSRLYTACAAQSRSWFAALTAISSVAAPSFWSAMFWS